MKRILTLLLILVTALSLTSCGSGNAGVEQDDSPVTMLAALGNSESYYRSLAEKIKTELGIDTQFVYYINCDTTSMTRLCFANNDLPADIVFTASKTDDALLRESCVDMLSNSSVTAQFRPVALEDCTTQDGAIYQLPVSTKLIGITYNETLMNEMGWQVPECFDDMVELKAKCDEAGIKFAVADGVATGHGFNWLFHLMGTQWLSTFEGTDWLNGFQAGTRSVDDFKAQCDYFKKWTEAGLWGSFHNQDWNGSKEFSQTRALFWYGLTNSASGYDGPEYDDDGKETGRTLHDTYKTMPWISEDGNNNCFTTYNNCWVYVNKALEAPDKSDKLSKVMRIIEFLASEDATAMVADMAKDTYVSVNSFDMGGDRIYSNYREQIRTGFVQPWYYNFFDMDSIVFTGEVVNNYIAGTGSYDEIFAVLDQRNQNMLNARIEVLANFPDGLGFEDTAKLVAISAAEALDETLRQNGRSERVDVTIAPYTPGDNLLQPWKGSHICNSIVYKGDLDASMAQTVFPQSSVTPCGIFMTGAEIKAIVEKGYDPSDRYIDAATGKSAFDSEHYGPYPYVCLVKDGAELEDDGEYLVALCDGYITLADYTSFSESGRLLTGLSGLCSNQEGLKLFAGEHPVITAESLAW